MSRFSKNDIYCAVIVLLCLVLLNQTASTAGHNFNGIRNFWTFCARKIADRTLYDNSGGLCDTTPVPYLLIMFFMKTVKWEYLGAVLRAVLLLTNALTVFALYKEFRQKKYSFLIPLMLLTFPGIEISLSLAMMFFALAVTSKNERIKCLFFSLSTLSKQTMLFPVLALAVLEMYKKKKVNLGNIVCFAIPWTAVLLYFGPAVSIDTLFFYHSRQTFSINNELLVPYAVACAVSGILLMLSKKTDRTNLALVSFISILFIFISNNKEGADNYFSFAPFFIALEMLWTKTDLRKILMVFPFLLSFFCIVYAEEIMLADLAGFFLEPFSGLNAGKILFYDPSIPVLTLPENLFKNSISYDVDWNRSNETITDFILGPMFLVKEENPETIIGNADCTAVPVFAGNNIKYGSNSLYWVCTKNLDTLVSFVEGYGSFVAENNDRICSYGRSVMENFRDVMQIGKIEHISLFCEELGDDDYKKTSDLRKTAGVINTLAILLAFMTAIKKF